MRYGKCKEKEGEFSLDVVFEKFDGSVMNVYS